ARSKKFLASPQFLVLWIQTRVGQGTISCNFSSVTICDEEETEEISADDFVIHGGFNFPAQYRSLVSIQGEAPGEIPRARGAAGKGEHGKPYPLTEEDHDDSAYRENGFNIFVSNNIALERSLPDIRHANCKHKMYLERLPNTSIIIPFHNEGWTSLLRTIHSIINRTPESLIAEIILVDDFSDRGKSLLIPFYVILLSPA
uniref:Polypeptide N-acetylgalactosaminyltransferase like 6 n=1 Tax=Ovis aries TaxID=9940 RepID=A0AC11D6V0_SHEEP